MQIIELTLSNLDLYCPVTGEPICLEDSGYNDEAKSLKGYWVNEIMDQPFVKDKKLEDDWESFVAKFEDENDYFPGSMEMDDFLTEYDSPNWIVFKICTYGMMGDIAWFVLNMDKEENL